MQFQQNGVDSQTLTDDQAANYQAATVVQAGNIAMLHNPFPNTITQPEVLSPSNPVNHDASTWHPTNPGTSASSVNPPNPTVSFHQTSAQSNPNSQRSPSLARSVASLSHARAPTQPPPVLPTGPHPDFPTPPLSVNTDHRRFARSRKERGPERRR